MKNARPSISFHTIGCRVNQYETAVLRNAFADENLRIVAASRPSDIAVVNTCTVTAGSDADTRRLVNRLIRLNPEVKIALVGCQAQLQGEMLKNLPNVRWVVGNAKKLKLARIIRDSVTPGPYFDIEPAQDSVPFRMEHYGVDKEHTRANLKIQDGCDQFCAYCEVPYARGRARSREFQDILAEANALVKAGHQEIVLTGINTGAYWFEHKNLLDVIKALEDIPLLKRIRISSIEPAEIVDDIVTYLAGKTKLCRYLHVPVQHGHDEILTRMGRRYSAETFLRMIARAADMVPDICIGTDVIAGFPGEAEDHFEQTYHLLKTSPVRYFHVFSFSRRNNARAKDFPGQVRADVIRKRSERLRALSRRKRRQFFEEMTGKTVPVLFEQKKGGFWHGVTDHFIQVGVSSDRDLKNTFRRVVLTGIGTREMNGELV